MHLRVPRWVDGLWLSALLLYVLAGVALVPFHADEATQIFMGRDFYYQVVQGDVQQVRYRAWETLSGDEATEQDLRLLNGTLPKYLFGAVAYGSGYGIDEINEQWVWGAGWEWNHDNGHVPPDGLLLRARSASALLLGVAAVALFVAAQRAGGRMAAYVASAFFVLNPAVLINGRRAMMEGGLLAFSLLVLLVGLLLLSKPSWWRYGLLGIVSGLAVASKHTAVFTAVAVFGACAALAAWHRRGERRTLSMRLVGLFGAGVMSLLVFYALNPAWWGAPVERAGQVLERRSELLQGQIDTYGGYATWGERLAGFWTQAIVVPPMYAETNVDGFLDNLSQDIAAYEASPWDGIQVGASIPGALLTVVLAGLGVLSLLQQRGDEAGERWLLLAWAALLLGTTLLLTPLEWQRYYVPTYPALALLVGLGGAFFVNKLRAA